MRRRRPARPGREAQRCPRLADVRAQMRTRWLTVATVDGKWAMGLALVHEGTAA